MFTFKKTELSSRAYRVVAETRYHVDLGSYHTYGIQAAGQGFSMVLHDVAADKQTVTAMAALFNRVKLSPIHLKDVVEDMLP